MNRKPLLANYFDQLSEPCSRSSVITLLAIIVLGFLLRFLWLEMGDAYHYLAINDEITAYQYAMRFLSGDPVTFYLGQPDFAGGKAPGPYFTLFWVMAYLLGGKSLYGAIVVVLSLNSLVIYFVYRLARQFQTNPYALLTALLFSTAPWVIYYAVGLWNPMLLAALGVVLFLSLWQVCRRDQSRAIFWVCILLALIPHFHMIGLFYIPAVLLVLYAMPTKLNRRGLIVGVMAAVILYMPYIIGDALHGWQNTRQILSGQGGDGFSASVLKILSAPATVMSNVPSRWLGPEFSSHIEFGNNYFIHHILLTSVNLLSLLFALYIFYHLLVRFLRLLGHQRFSLKAAFASQPETVFLAIMIFVPLLMFLPTGHNYATRYSILAFPLLFLIYSLRLEVLFSTRWKNAFKLAAVFAIGFNIYLNLAFFHQVQTQLAAREIFMPSFMRLTAIQQDLEARYPVLPAIELAPQTRNLSELERTLLKALPSFLNIQNIITHPAEMPVSTSWYIAQQDMKPGLNTPRIVYEDYAIILFPQP